MPTPKLSKLELQIMDVFWTRGPCSVREVQEALPGGRRPAYSTVQTMIYRMEAKKVLRRAKKISNAHIFEAVVSRQTAQRRWIDEFLGLFGGGMQPLMTQLIETGLLTLDDVQEAERTLRQLVKKGKQK